MRQFHARPAFGTRTLIIVTALASFALLVGVFGTRADGGVNRAVGPVTTLHIPQPDARQLSILEGGVTDDEINSVLGDVAACMTAHGYSVGIELFIPKVEWIWIEAGHAPGVMSEATSDQLFRCEVEEGGEVLYSYLTDSRFAAAELARYEQKVQECMALSVSEDVPNDATYSELRAVGGATFARCALAASAAVQREQSD